MVMRVIEAKTFSGYGGLRQTELPKPQPAKDRVLVRVTAAGVTPLDHTILSGAHTRYKTQSANHRSGPLRRQTIEAESACRAEKAMRSSR
jgi:NADPH:quinone reductase-like Zn-dependent oxidoreductase